MFEERKTIAANEGRRMRPVSTGEVRSRLASLRDPPPNLKKPLLLISALRQLMQTNGAKIRKVDLEGRRMVFWAPTEVPDENLDLGDVYAKDTERVAEALRRSVERLGRPVTAREVQREVEIDQFLRPVGTSSFASTLSDAARASVGWENRARRTRVTRHVFKVGRVNGDAYYFHDPKKLSQAQAYVHLRQLESIWVTARTEDNLKSLKTCTLRTIAVGRAMLIIAETRKLLEEIERLFVDYKMDVFTRKEAARLRTLVRRVAEEVTLYPSTYEVSDFELPQEVATEVPGLTAEELLPYIKPVYPRARRIKVPNEIVRLLAKDEDIRRIPNPHFNNRFDNDPHLAAEYLYDRSDALIYVASLGSGYECRLQAHFARNELGWLRDPRFIYPALYSEDFNERLIAVSCLAFLWSVEGNKHLRSMAAGDPDPGVRQSALWAYGFADRVNAFELFSIRAQEDPDPSVREFAYRAVTLADLAWWLV
ncbi:MAG: hypothetical protein LC802_04810 [Acidobacteria bacterium]|nr:hypothetical protein [Acidobacteriota bacterium]